MRSKGIQCSSSKMSKLLYAFGSKEPLKASGTFKTSVRVEYKELFGTEFVVSEGKVSYHKEGTQP